MDNNQSTEPVKSSFFDDANIENYAFWKKKAHLKKHSDVKLMEGNLFRKSSRTNFWKSRYYILYEDRLAYHKVSNLSEGLLINPICRIEDRQKVRKNTAIVSFIMSESSNLLTMSKTPTKRTKIRKKDIESDCPTINNTLICMQDRKNCKKNGLIRYPSSVS